MPGASVSSLCLRRPDHHQRDLINHINIITIVVITVINRCVRQPKPVPILCVYNSRRLSKFLHVFGQYESRHVTNFMDYSPP
jgi:hypothetical protein